jgi:hypothetical protein
VVDLSTPPEEACASRNGVTDHQCSLLPARQGFGMWY